VEWVALLNKPALVVVAAQVGTTGLDEITAVQVLA
jgi:hypothetical protein